MNKKIILLSVIAFFKLSNINCAETNTRDNLIFYSEIVTYLADNYVGRNIERGKTLLEYCNNIISYIDIIVQYVGPTDARPNTVKFFDLTAHEQELIRYAIRHYVHHAALKLAILS